MNESSFNKSSKVLSLFSSSVSILLFVLVLFSSWDKVFLISSRFLLSMDILETFLEILFFNLASFSCFSFSNLSFSCLSFSNFSCLSFSFRSFSFCRALTSLKKSLIFSLILIWSFFGYILFMSSSIFSLIIYSSGVNHMKLFSFILIKVKGRLLINSSCIGSFHFWKIFLFFSSSVFSLFIVLLLLLLFLLILLLSNLVWIDFLFLVFFSCFRIWEFFLLNIVSFSLSCKLSKFVINSLLISSSGFSSHSGGISKGSTSAMNFWVSLARSSGHVKGRSSCIEDKN